MTKLDILKAAAAEVRAGGQPGANSAALTGVYLFAEAAKPIVERIRDQADDAETAEAAADILADIEVTLAKGLPVQ